MTHKQTVAIALFLIVLILAFEFVPIQERRGIISYPLTVDLATNGTPPKNCTPSRFSTASKRKRVFTTVTT